MINNQSIAQITGATAERAAQYGPLLNDAMVKFEINTPARVLAFLSQVGHESGGLFYLEEIASGDAYDTRTDLGNTAAKDGDGRKYKGRGFIQITGKANYQKVSDALGQDFVNHPEMLSQPKWAALGSAWWWKNRGLNQVADGMDVNKPIDDATNTSVFKAITKKINGGLNGLADRVKRWKAGQPAMVQAAVQWVKQNPGKSSAAAAGFVIALSFSIILLMAYVADKK